MKSIEQIIRQNNVTDFGITSFCYDLISCRAKSRVPIHPKRVIICLFPYYSPALKGNISKYAMVPNYHTVLTEKLDVICAQLAEETKFSFVPFVDSSPIPEVRAAVRAGLGVLGDNQLLIHPRFGSYLFLGEIVTDMDGPIKEYPLRRCLQCGRCKKACPLCAIEEDRIATDRCLSNISQSKQHPTPQQEAALFQNQILWGCDICQDVCPMNQNIETTSIQAFRQDIITQIPYEKIDELVLTRAFGFRGSNVLKRNFRIIYPHHGNTETNSNKKG